MKPALSIALVASLLICGVASAFGPPIRASQQRPNLEAKVKPIEGKIRKRVTGSSWHHGCPVPRSKLRFIGLNYWGFDHDLHRGSLIVKKSESAEMVEAMRTLFRHRFPIRRMHLVDRYGADDHRSMNADNTSAFNCREVAGSPGVWSMHAYGKAIDLNPRENPYVTSSGYVSPPAGEPYADRSRHAKGMVHRGDIAFKAFKRVGWAWGGDWNYPKDYQHFSANGR